MRSLSPRSLGAILLLGMAGPTAAQVQQVGNGQPNSANGIFVTGMAIESPISTPCDNSNFQAATPGTPWNQNYGSTANYFSLPAGNGNQTFSMYFNLFRSQGGMFNTPTIQVFVDGELCTTCNAQVTSYNTSGGGTSATGNINVTHQAGHAWATNGIREFGLRFTFPPQAGPWLDIRFKAVMVGTSFTEVLGTYDAPALPLFILRDPPGGNSFSSLTTGSNTCFGNTRSVKAGNEQGGYFKTKIGVAGEAGFIVTTAFEFSVEVGVSINATQTETSEFEYKTCLSVSNQYNTSNDGTPDDVFIGQAVRYKYGMATVIERPTCGTVTKDAYFVSAPDSTLMDYLYSESYIRNQVIPGLESQIAQFTPGTPAHRRAVVQRDVWLRTLEINQEIKSAGPPAVVRSFIDPAIMC